MSQDDEGSDVVFVEPLGNVALRKISNPLIDVWCLELSQAALGLVQIIVAHVPRGYQDDVLFFLVRLKVRHFGVVTACRPYEPAEQEATGDAHENSQNRYQEDGPSSDFALS
jgi:hypothetical protein